MSFQFPPPRCEDCGDDNKEGGEAIAWDYENECWGEFCALCEAEFLGLVVFEGQ